MKPNSKVTAGAGGGMILAPLVVWVWDMAMPDTPMPAPVAAILGGFLGSIVAYFKKEMVS